MKQPTSQKLGFTLIELIVSVALFLVAITIALLATVGTNGLVVRTDARSVIAEGGRVINDVLRRTVVNAPVGSVALLDKYSTNANYAGVQVKTYAWDQSQNVCQVVGRAVATTADNKETFTLDPAGTAMAVWIYPLDSGLHCPSLTTPTLYQNRLTDKEAVVRDFQAQFITVNCNGVAGCTTKQQLRYKFSLEVATASRGQSAETKRPSIEVDSSIPIGLINESIAGPDLITASIPHGASGQAYTAFAFSAVGGTPGYTWSLSGASLPSGMSLSSGGILSGTPCSSCSGTTDITFTVTDSGNPQRHDSRILSLVIDTASIPLTITTASPLPSGATGVAYSTTLSGTGGTPAYTWSLANGTTLPAGLTLGSSSGTISGTISAPTGVYSFTVRLADTASHITTKDFSLSVDKAVQ